MIKSEPIGSAKRIMSNPLSKHNYFGWPTVARLQNGKLAAVASGFRLAHVCPFGQVVISYSEDEGETFTRPAVAFDTPLDDRDAGILPFGEKGVMLTSFNNSVNYQRSYCINYSGSSPYILGYLDTVKKEEEAVFLGATYAISRDGGFTFGEVKRAPVSSPHGPCLLSDSTVLFAGCEIQEDKDRQMDMTKITAFAFYPAEERWEKRGSVPSVDGYTFCEAHAVEAKDGTLLCFIRVQGGGGLVSDQKFTVYQAESHDGGKTWSPAHQILGDFGGAPPHALCLPTGRVVLTYGVRVAPFCIRAKVSDDCGKSWSNEVDVSINGVSPDLGYPSTVALSDGSLLSVFYAHRDEGAPAEIFAQKWKLID